ncbi:hypothetical protein An02g08360 [Aspergillus niger]|uniref:Uncharacterized protein n=2 Tax=Aspergillus niger TaxID=5061 RepID=A2QDU7_ASPNC|nr:hypothetical protein An02g08360 [Aspergillus niger]CAK37798.1 hypothetical protein An02g08360 [Aspergillus niger]
MVLQVKSKAAMYNVPRYGDIPNVFFDIDSRGAEDLLGTSRSEEKNPIVGSWFRIEKGPEATPPTYSYDEVGVVIEDSYGVAWKCGGREMARL